MTDNSPTIEDSLKALQISYQELVKELVAKGLMFTLEPIKTKENARTGLLGCMVLIQECQTLFYKEYRLLFATEYDRGEGKDIEPSDLLERLKVSNKACHNKLTQVLLHLLTIICGCPWVKDKEDLDFMYAIHDTFKYLTDVSTPHRERLKDLHNCKEENSQQLAFIFLQGGEYTLSQIVERIHRLLVSCWLTHNNSGGRQVDFDRTFDNLYTYKDSAGGIYFKEEKKPSFFSKFFKKS